jgi:acyl-CoA thioesterase-1
MKYTMIIVFSMLLCGSTLVRTVEAQNDTPDSDSQVETSKKPTWSFTPDPSLPNVLILGDSISIGYTRQVRELLKGKANVFRPLSPNGANAMNCQGTTLGLTQIDSWLVGRNWAVVHFNWGLHDLKHVTEAGTSNNSSEPTDPYQATVEEYTHNMEALVGKLKATHAQLIFATTTPVVPESSGPFREVDAPGRYNDAALKIMKTNDIAVNDLFAFCEPQLEKMQLPKNVHFKPAGSAALAKQVAAAIETALRKPADAPTKSP